MSAREASDVDVDVVERGRYYKTSSPPGSIIISKQRLIFASIFYFDGIKTIDVRRFIRQRSVSKRNWLLNDENEIKLIASNRGINLRCYEAIPAVQAMITLLKELHYKLPEILGTHYSNMLSEGDDEEN